VDWAAFWAIFFATSSGVYVMITIFCDFCQFSAKILAFFSKTNAMIKFLQKVAAVWTKNANIFCKFFGENISKITTSVPGHPAGESLRF
jgi:hypothetical protein